MKVGQFLPLSELCGDVSDDFGLLHRALVTGYEDPWLSALGHEYIQQRIPTGRLKPLDKDLKSVLGI